MAGSYSATESEDVMVDKELVQTLETKLVSLKQDRSEYVDKLLGIALTAESEAVFLVLARIAYETATTDTPEMRRIIKHLETAKRELSLQRQPQVLDKTYAKSVSCEKILESFGITVKRGKALCPFHSDTTPSLSVHRQSNTWRCFGCGAKGDGIELFRRLASVSFVEAVRSLSAY